MSLKKCIGNKLLGTNNVIVYWKNALLKFAESVFFFKFVFQGIIKIKRDIVFAASLYL